MPLRLRGNDAAHPFVTSDLWRGFLTSCHQTDVHVEREYRYYPVELTIDAVVGTKVTATFVTHADHSFYELKGEYEEATRRLYLTPVRGVVGRRWEPCDAEVYISHDGTTLSGNSICDQHGECDDGGGEFVLRHDRTQLVVEGAGLAGVNGIYTSQRNAADLSAVATPSQAEQDGRLYDGAPIYVQACSGECAQHAVIHVVNGQYGFWQIIEASLLKSDAVAVSSEPASDTNDADGVHVKGIHSKSIVKTKIKAAALPPMPALYTVCSEEVYPPMAGWRPTKAALAPPPMLRLDVASMYSELTAHARLNTQALLVDSDARANALVALLFFGALISSLLVVLGRSRVRLKASAEAKAALRP